LVKAASSPLRPGSKKTRLAFVGDKTGADHAVLATDPDQAVHIDIVARDQDFALPGAVQRHAHHRFAAIDRLETVGRVEVAVDRLGSEIGQVAGRRDRRATDRRRRGGGSRRSVR
jgi:hypothetical protein